MLEFRNDMLKLSKKYPDITKVVITKEAWGNLCSSFDKTLGNVDGDVENHIKECNGSMQFETLFVEKEDA